MSKATSQAFSSYRRNRTVLSFRERYRLTVFVSNGTVAVMAQRGVSLKSVLTCYEKNKMIFFFIWAVIDFLTINISWFLLNIKQHPSPISRKPQTVLNVWMAWIVCIVLFSYHKCACPMSRAIAATFWPRGRRALRARRPRGPNVKKHFLHSGPAGDGRAIWKRVLSTTWRLSGKWRPLHRRLINIVYRYFSNTLRKLSPFPNERSVYSTAVLCFILF